MLDKSTACRHREEDKPMANSGIKEWLKSHRNRCNQEQSLNCRFTQGTADETKSVPKCILKFIAQTGDRERCNICMPASFQLCKIWLFLHGINRSYTMITRLLTVTKDFAFYYKMWKSGVAIEDLRKKAKNGVKHQIFKQIFKVRLMPHIQFVVHFSSYHTLD